MAKTSRKRSGASQLLRLLDHVTAPVYALDDARRIIYCNQACSDWLGLSSDELEGVACAYHSSPLGSPVELAAAAICPPPESFLGTATSGLVSALRDDARDERHANFIPLPTDGGFIVIGLVRPAGGPDDSGLLPAGDVDAELHDQVARFRQEMRRHFRADAILGASPAMRRVRDQVQLATTANCGLMIVGPCGSGRQFLAKAIHYAQAAGEDAPLVPLSCTVLGPVLLQSTMAALVKNCRDRVTATTLLLNDIDQLPSEVQSDLIALLENKSLNLRVMGTSARSPTELAAEGVLREDLAYLLSTLVIELPPLASRKDDIPQLAQLVLEEVNASGGKQLRGFSSDALDALVAYHWPGELSELIRFVREAHAAAEGPVVQAKNLPERIRLTIKAKERPPRADETIDLEKFLAQVETELIHRAMSRAKGNKSKAARSLGMTRPRLYRRMVQLGLAEEPTTEAAADFEPIDFKIDESEE